MCEPLALLLATSATLSFGFDTFFEGIFPFFKSECFVGLFLDLLNNMNTAENNFKNLWQKLNPNTEKNTEKRI